MAKAMIASKASNFLERNSWRVSEEKTVDYGGDIGFHCGYDGSEVALSADYILLSTLIPTLRFFRPGQIQIRLIAFQYFPWCHHPSLTQIMRQFRR